MGEVIETGEMTGDGYEFPIVCPLNICPSGPLAASFEDGKWRCDTCGKVVIYWSRDNDPIAKGENDEQ